MEGVDLEAALALLLRADLAGPRQGIVEHHFEVRAAHLAGQPDAQQTQLPAIAVKLLGMGVAARHQGGPLGDSQVRLPQLHAVPVGQVVEPLDCSVRQLGVGREGDVLELHRGIDGDAGQVASSQGAAVMRHPQRLGQQQLELVPSRLRQWLSPERSCGNSCWKNSSPVKYWK